MQKRNFCIILILTLLTGLCTYAYLVQQEQQTLAAQLIRLHVVANSDSAEDQALKLEVRDVLLPLIGSLTEHCQTREEAEDALRESLPALRSAAQSLLSCKGILQPVAVELTQERFPRRNYETFSLPAGQYTSLRVSIGAARGHNWWCVVFPSLCLPASTEGFVEAAQTAGLTSEQTDLISSDTVEVELKFQLLEWLQALFG